MVSNPGPEELPVGSPDADARTGRTLTAARRTLRGLDSVDSRAWRSTCRAPLQFIRWLAALGTVIGDWLKSNGTQSAAAYVPVLVVVALLLLPDAQSIAVAGLKFERLKSEVATQQQAVARLSAEVWSLHNSLSASSQVSVAFGAISLSTVPPTGLAPPGTHSGGEPAIPPQGSPPPLIPVVPGPVAAHDDERFVSTHIPTSA